MGKPLPAGVGATGAPASGDQANAVLSGTISAVGPTNPFAFRGSFNVAIYATINTTLTATAGSGSATVASAAGLAAGDAINSPAGVVPQGVTIGALVGTTVTLAFPPNFAAANVVGGADAGALFTGSSIAWSASLQLEKSFDGGATWLVDQIFAGGGPAVMQISEPERNVAYRLNCTSYTSGVINYRISQTGAGATSLDVNIS